MGAAIPKLDNREANERLLLIQKRQAHEKYSIRLQKKSIELEDEMLNIRNQIFKQYHFLEQYYKRAQECSRETSQCGFYRGEIQNHLCHGIGEELHFEEENLQPISYYLGQFQKELKSGKGCMIYPSGEYYVGDFKDGFANGQGKYVLADQSYYEGSWVNNLQEGKGVIEYSNKAKYEGDFKAGYMWGEGRYIWENGNIFQGQFEKDQIKSGEAIYHQKPIVYHGQFRDGVPHGRGRSYNKADQSYYDGHYVQGKRHGFGQTNEGGQIVKGRWQNNVIQQ